MEIPLCIIIWILLASKAFYSLWIVSWSDNNRLQFFSMYLLKDSWNGMFKDSKDTEWSLVYIWLLKLPPISLFLLSTVFSNWLRSKELVRICETLLAASIIVSAIPPSIFLACVLTTIVYAVIGYILRSKTLIWSLTLCSLFYVEEAVRILRRFSVIEAVHEDETFEKATVLQSAAALIILRASSVGLEFANKPSSLPRTVLVNQLALPVLLEAVCYATYPPTFYFGPLVSFSDWCAWRKEVFQVEISAFIEISPNFRGGLTQRPLCARSLTLRAIRLLLWLFVWETILHIVYPNAVLFLATQPAADVPPPPPPPPALGSSVSGRFHASPHLETDRSALGGAVYLIGLQFFFAYMQLYGWPRLLSDVQVYLMARSHSPLASNVFTCLVPDGPPCPTHVFLFSEMWRKFDRGLYNFLKWYIYLPWLKPTERTVRKKTLSLAIPPHHPVSLVQRLQGGILCFLFVLIFHSCNSQNAVWVGINTIQILLERFFKWTYHNTIYGEKLRDSLSDASLRRITGILCSISAIFSSIGFFYFYLGFTSGQWIGYWMLVDPVYRVIAIVCYYCTYQISLAAERWYTSK